jgi:hypothetical protein
MAGQLIPNLAVERQVAIARPATIEEVEGTRQLTMATNINLDTSDPNAALHILAAIGQLQDLEYAMVPEPDRNVAYDSWNNPADFAMENGIITEGSLSLLGSSAVQHHVKGFSLHLAHEFRALKANPTEMASFVSDVRRKLAQLHNVPADRVVIMSVRDGTMVIDYAIADPDPTTLPSPEQYREVFLDAFIACFIHRSFVQLQIKPSTFAPRWNRDYRDRRNWPVGERRGGYPYEPPKGWQRFGMNVEGKYGNDETWLGCSGKQGEWSVAYHGTSSMNVKNLTETAFKPGPRQTFGFGIYCSPNPGVAEHYSKDPIVLNTRTGRKTCKYMFMCRVNTGNVCRCTEKICRNLNNKAYTLHITKGSNEWLIAGQNAGAEYIRPYGILVKEI